MYPKLFQRNPIPWIYKPDAAECGNGSSIDVIEDANGECVASSYWSTNGFKALWEMYNMLTPEQLIELGSQDKLEAKGENDE